MSFIPLRIPGQKPEPNQKPNLLYGQPLHLLIGSHLTIKVNNYVKTAGAAGILCVVQNTLRKWAVADNPACFSGGIFTLHSRLCDLDLM